MRIFSIFSANIGRNELRGVPNWDRVTDFQLMLHIQPGRVEVTPVNGDVSVDCKVLQSGSKTQVTNKHWNLNLVDAGIQLQCETVKRKSPLMKATAA